MSGRESHGQESKINACTFKNVTTIMSILMKLVNTPTEITLTTLIFINQIIS